MEEHLMPRGVGANAGKVPGSGRTGPKNRLRQLAKQATPKPFPTPKPSPIKSGQQINTAWARQMAKLQRMQANPVTPTSPGVKPFTAGVKPVSQLPGSAANVQKAKRRLNRITKRLGR